MTDRETVATLIRARTSLIWIRTAEERRVEAEILTAVRTLKSYAAFLWDCALGALTALGEILTPGPDVPTDPVETLQFIRRLTVADNYKRREGREVWILRDFHAWLADPVTLRLLKSTARALTDSKDTKRVGALVVVVPESAAMPPELAGVGVEIAWQRPTREDIPGIIRDVMGGEVNGELPAVADAARGLTAPQIEQAVSMSLAESGRLDASIVNRAKVDLISAKGISWREPDPDGFERIGGLETVKTWLSKRRAALSPEARALGVPTPKGMLLTGVPGCGKSLLATCTGAAWRLPIAELDLGATKSKFVGDSESALRSALAVVDSVAPCILFVDEIEKALGGSADSGATDGGVSTDQLNYLLRWLQDREGAVFSIFTANRPELLPPELVRAGRLDKVWFVDLPTATERACIWSIFLGRAGGFDPEDMSELVNLSSGWTGAEIESAVGEAQTSAFSERGERLQWSDLRAAVDGFTPQSERDPDGIARIREWITKGRATSASAPDVAEAPAPTAGRLIER